MANNNENNTQVLDPEAVSEEQAAAVPEAEVPAVKTKKELKKERKEIKKHKKEVKKEAKKHSAKATRAYKFLITVVSLVVIAAMLACSVMAVQITMNLNGTAASSETGDNSSDSPAASSDSNNSSSSANSDTSASDDTAASDTSSDATDSSTSEDSTAESGDSAAAGAETPLGSKADVVEYYKTAHAKVLSEAKSVTRTYDNTLNYKDYLEVGGNSTLAGVAKQLMGMFMKENTEALTYTGADIASNFPPENNSCSGLTADMIGDYSVTEEGDNYIIKLSINSTEESPDLGENSANLVRIVQSKQVEDAAAGFVEFTGLENRYIAATVTATINKITGQMTALETDTPSYMCFASATVMKIITVDNVGIGLEYQQKWTIEW